MTAPLTGHCLCGAVTVTVRGTHDPRVGACHCRMCQRWSGGLFLCFTAALEAVTVTGEVRRYRSSSFAERAFCPACGSHLWFNDVDEGGEGCGKERSDKHVWVLSWRAGGPVGPWRSGR